MSVNLNEKKKDNDSDVYCLRVCHFLLLFFFFFFFFFFGL